jgi:uncharacterized membrane protein
MLAVVFDNESKAYEGLRALNQLDAEGSITVYSAQVVQKGADGKLSAKQTEGDFPIRTLAGFSLGSLLGLLGGPVGLAIGSDVGASAGAISDMFIADVDSSFLDEVSGTLKPGKVAVVANVSEEWVTPVDTRMEALGGTVFRTARKHFEADQRAKEVETLKAEINQLKAEQAQAQADRKTKLQARLDDLNTKFKRKQVEANQRSEQIQNEADAKVQALQKKAASAQGDAKAKLEARLNDIKKGYAEDRETLKTMFAA